MKPFVSVVIPVYNNCKRLPCCLVALQGQGYPQDCYEVILVDNGKNEGIEEITVQFSQVKLIREPRPGSYAARNKGIASARGEIIAFTDSDCIPETDWIAKGVAQLLSAPNCGLVGGRIEQFFKTPSHPNIVEYYSSISYLNQKRLLDESHGASAANLFTLKKIFNTAGLFNESLYSGGDCQWAERVFSRGYSQKYAHGVVVRHPACNSFRAIHSRIVRQVGAMYILSHAQGKPLKLPFRPDLFKRNIFAQSQDEVFKKFKYKLSFFLISLVVAICKFIEFTRLLLGGSPGR